MPGLKPIPAAVDMRRVHPGQSPFNQRADKQRKTTIHISLCGQFRVQFIYTCMSLRTVGGSQRRHDTKASRDEHSINATLFTSCVFQDICNLCSWQKSCSCRNCGNYIEDQNKSVNNLFSGALGPPQAKRKPVYIINDCAFYCVFTEDLHFLLHRVKLEGYFALYDIQTLNM